MTHPSSSNSKPEQKSMIVGILMLVVAFSCLLLDLLFSEGAPESLGVAVFCFLFVYGLAKLRNKTNL